HKSLSIDVTANHERKGFTIQALSPVPHHVHPRAHNASSRALLPISKGSQALCQHDPASAEVAGGTVTAGNMGGFIELLVLYMIGIFTTTATAVCVVCDKLTAKGNGVL